MIGLCRARNESLIIADTIAHFLRRCEHIILYDDCSTDNTVEIAADIGGRRITIIHGDEWRAERTAEETRHRAILLERARRMGAYWCLYFDADERLIGDMPALTGDGFRFRLFDGYLTKMRRQPYRQYAELAQLPRMWGPEFRDILMLFRTDKARYAGLDRREPILSGEISLADVKVKHFGKCISVEQWEETCTYYAENFPEPYKSKWAGRRGKAMHTESDFGRPLFTWRELMNHQDAWCRL